jgi:hypothetical protein
MFARFGQNLAPGFKGAAKSSKQILSPLSNANRWANSASFRPLNALNARAFSSVQAKGTVPAWATYDPYYYGEKPQVAANIVNGSWRGNDAYGKTHTVVCPMGGSK